MTKLLLVEDEAGLANALKHSLERENYDVTWAADGEEGLLHALSGCFDLLILDIMLPKRDGFSIVREVRSAKLTIPILMLTARTELDDKIRGLDNGADDYLTKPFQTRELLARLRALTRRCTGSDDTILSFGDLELDTSLGSLRCTGSGHSMQLSAREFQLLHYLLQNKNQILTREQLAQRIWGLESNAEYNNVEVYLSFLRKKLTFLCSTVRIKAIRGLGYTLLADGDGI
ncbi:MAG: response regulator transcription factor [Lachnospiraceae bacterium]|nr:response regulator transcription factor [Lachnospiraceae bacterium]